MGKAQKPIKLTLYCSGVGIRIRMAKIINMILAILFFSSIPITPFTGYTMCLSSWGQALHLFYHDRYLICFCLQNVNKKIQQIPP